MCDKTIAGTIQITDKEIQGELFNFFAFDKKISFLKLIKKELNLGIVESKLLTDVIWLQVGCDELSFEEIFVIEQATVIDKINVVGKIDIVEPTIISEFINHYDNSFKLKFIKLLKDVTGWNLIMCKDFTIEAFELAKNKVINIEDVFSIRKGISFPYHCSIDGQIGYAVKNGNTDFYFFHINNLFSLDYTSIDIDVLKEAVSI